jgi:hypothetical protein
MADDPKSKKKQNYVEYLKVEASQIERRKKLWDALSRFVHSQGDAWMISVPGAKNLRIECKQGSALPAKLSELGYSPRHCGMNTRIVSGGFTPVDVIEITLGK